MNEYECVGLVLLFLGLVGWGVLGTLRYVNDGVLAAMNTLITNEWGSNLKLCLFKNNYTVLDTTVLANLTEADFTGYARITLSGGDFGAPVALTPGYTTAVAAKVFTVGVAPSTTNQIYGYFILNVLTGKLEWAENDANAPIPMTIAGQTYTVQLNLNLTSVA